MIILSTVIQMGKYATDDIKIDIGTSVAQLHVYHRRRNKTKWTREKSVRFMFILLQDLTQQQCVHTCA